MKIRISFSYNNKNYQYTIDENDADMTHYDNLWDWWVGENDNEVHYSPKDEEDEMDFEITAGKRFITDDSGKEHDMMREILNKNISNLCERDIDILKYVTGKAPLWFELSTTTDDEIVDVLYNCFSVYLNATENKCVHPFYKTFKKITLGVRVERIIYQTDLYGEEYKRLAENVNKLWRSECRYTICAILKAFAERDFDELQSRFCDEITLDYVKEHITKFADLIADNLDECDLRCILQFCGWHNVDN